MSEYIEGESGQQALFGWESTPGTEAGTIDKQLGITQSVDPIDLGFESKDGYSITSYDRLYAREIRANYAFSVEFYAINFRFLHFLFGIHNVSAGPPYTHTLTQGAKPSASFEIINDDLAVSRKVLGCQAVGGEINWAEGEEISGKIDFIGRDAEKEATPQSSTDTAKVPLFADEITIVDVNSVSRLSDVISGSWKFGQNAEARHSVGSIKPRFIKQGKRLYSIDLEMYQQNMTIWDLVQNKTEFQTQLKFVRTASSDEATFTFPQCRIFNPGQAIPGDDVLMESPTIEVMRDYGSEIITASIIDDLADYTA